MHPLYNVQPVATCGVAWLVC